MTDDYEYITYNSLRVLKDKGIRIICKGKDITDELEDLE